jgi:hypothetical protein
MTNETVPFAVARPDIRCTDPVNPQNPNPQPWMSILANADGCRLVTLRATSECWRRHVAMELSASEGKETAVAACAAGDLRCARDSPDASVEVDSTDSMSESGDGRGE